MIISLNIAHLLGKRIMTVVSSEFILVIELVIELELCFNCKI